MAEDVRAESAQPVANATTEIATATPDLLLVLAGPETVPDAKAETAAEPKLGLASEVKIERAVEAKVECATDIKPETTTETTVIEPPKAEIAIPPAPQFDPLTASAAPPVFLREHEQRTPPRPAVAPKASAKAPPAKAPPAKAPSTPAEAKPKSRFTLLAATLALSAGLGAAAGAVGVPLVTHITSAPAIAAAPVPTTDTSAEINALRGVVAQLTTELGAVRTAVEQSGKTTTAHIGKLSERIDRSERAQAEPAAKLAKIGEAIERLERRTPAPAAPPAHDVTGTIPTPPPAPPEAKAKPGPAVIDDYVVRKVFDGVALVEGRRGLIEVEPGMSLPGAGRVEEIRRQDGRWVVVTNKGIILSPR